MLRRLREIMAEPARAQARLDRLVRTIAANMVADVCSIYLRRAGDQLELFATHGLNSDAVHKTRLRWGEGLVGAIAVSSSPLNLRDAPSHPTFSYRSETGEDPFHSFLGVPILRSGRLLGVLVVQNETERLYTEEEVEALQTVAMVLAEVAASGELIDPAEFDDVDDVLHGPERFSAVGIVEGVGIGRAAFHEPPVQVINLIADDVAAEEERLQDAIEALRKSVDAMLAKMDRRLMGVPREVLETYRMFAHDRGWLNRLREAVLSGLTAEAAVQRVKGENRARMLQSDNAYLRDRLHDLDDLAHRLLRHLAGGGGAEPLNIPDDAILFARTLGPAELLEYDYRKLRGVVLGEGSAASHVAIVARALELPLIARSDDALDRTDANDPVIIDGAAGEVHVRPTADITQAYRAKLELQSERQAAFAAARDLPAVTRDGVEIDLQMNAGLLVDLPHLEETGASGIGLFRTELQFMVSTALPRLPQQVSLYRDVIAAAGDRPVVFRTVDLGSDKVLPYMQHEREDNPALGWRAIRLSLDRPGLMRLQLRALLQASAGRPLQVLFPMITIPEEIEAARHLLDREMERGRRLGQTPPTEVAVGAMIEVPAIAWRLDALLEQVDFISIGGNDLVQFFFAADRTSERIGKRYDLLSPAFLSFLSGIVAGAKAKEVPVSFCGEQASQPLEALGLLATGLRRLSAPATAIGPVKQMVRSLHLGELNAHIAPMLKADQASIREPLRNYAHASGVLI